MTRGLQAIVFDFDGVLANSEPLHLRAFQDVLAEHGIELTAADYYARYLGFDDVGAFTELAKDRGIDLSERQLATLVARKGVRLQQMLDAGEVLFPGAKELVREAAAAVPIAIASGALRHEIDEILQAAGLAHLFQAIVASGDTPESKPSPQPYRMAVERLREASGTDLEPRRCAAIEDSQWGLDSAGAAGLLTVGVASSYPAGRLRAHLVVVRLDQLTLTRLDRLVQDVMATSGAGERL